MLVSAATCRRYEVMPIALAPGRIVLAMTNPGDVFAIDDVREASGLQVVAVVAERSDLLTAIARYHRADDELTDLTNTLEEENAALLTDAFSVSDSQDDDAPIVRFVNLLVSQAIEDHASDIHIEPAENSVRVRYRIDGVLHEMQSAPKSIQNGVISRLKIMSDIDIAERRKPQDGRMSVNSGGRKIDLRVATLPTVWGEKVVMRILDNTNTSLDLRDLGLSEANGTIYRESYSKPYGMILVTGPDGFRQVDDPVLDAQPGRPHRGERHHRRGPGRVPHGRHQPGAGQPQGRPHLRQRPAQHPAIRPRRRAAR